MIIKNKINKYNKVKPKEVTLVHFTIHTIDSNYFTTTHSMAII
jgi:hypothetical protein